MRLGFWVAYKYDPNKEIRGPKICGVIAEDLDQAIDKVCQMYHPGCFNIVPRWSPDDKRALVMEDEG